MSEHKEPIPSMIYNASVGGHVTNSQQIIDENEDKEQSQINAEVRQNLGQGGSVDLRIANAVNEEKTRAKEVEIALDGRVGTLEETVGTGGSVDSRIFAAVTTETTRAQAAENDRYTKSETYTKEEVNNLITTPSQEYVSVTATSQTTSVTDVLPATGAADTTYRVGNWDGTQYNDSVFSEYAWNGSAYIKLSTKSQIGEVYNISDNHADTKYADLTAALGTNGANIPQSLQKGGMSIKFVQSSDNKYVQYRLKSSNFTTNIFYWESEDTESLIKTLNSEVFGNPVEYEYEGGQDIYVPISEIGHEFGDTIHFKASTRSFTLYRATSSLGLVDVIEIIWDSANEGHFVFNGNDVIDRICVYQLASEQTIVFIGKKTSSLQQQVDNINTMVNNIDGFFNGVWNDSPNMLGELLGASIVGLANYYHKVISVEGISKVRILANKINDSDFAFVKSYTPVSLSGTVSYDFATGETERRHINAGQETDSINVPNDAKYILIMSDDPNGNPTPSAIYFDDINVKDGMSDSLSEKVDVSVGANIYNGIFTDAAGFSSNGSVGTNPSWENQFRISDKIYFNDHDKIICNHCATGGFYSVIYDKNNIILSVIANTTETQIFSNVSGGSYIRITLTSTNKRKYPIVIGYGETLPYSFSEYSPVEGYKPKKTVLYAYGDNGTDDETHFYGSDAIRKAMNSIKDESPTNIYTIRATGEFIASLPSQYEEYGGSYAMFWPRPYIEIVGVGNCVVCGTLPDSLAECQVDTPSFVKAHYSLYQPVFVLAGCYIENITFIARNIRYPLHIEGAASYYAYNMEFVLKYCKLIHEGKFGDAVGTVGGSPSGFGSTSGATYTFEKCYFEGKDSILYIHDNINFTDINHILFKECKFNNRERSGDEISFPRLLNPIGTDISVINCDFNKYVGVRMVIDGNALNAERVGSFNKGRIKFTGNPKCTVVNFYQEKGLRVKAASDVSVRFDESSSAFDFIIGYSNETTHIDFNEYAREQQYGYVWRNGGTGISGDAVGLRNIQDSGSYTLGARLGDCSQISKTLTILVGEDEYNVNFDSDYTSVSNSTILSEINSVLNGAAEASLYSVSSEYYPEYDNMGVETVDDTSAILKGMGFVFTSNGIRKATNEDNRIDGIVIDDGAVGERVRVIYKGSYYLHEIKLSGTTTDSLSFGDTLYLSETGGYFATSGSIAVLKVGINSVEIL